MADAHILLVGGGTGGHIYPLIAVARKIKEQLAAQNKTGDLRYFGMPGDYEKLLTEEGIKITKISSSKLRRYASILNFLDFFKFFFGFMQAMVKLYFFMPEVLFSKSGPGVLPIIYAARWYRIPVIIHESDAVPGLTNRASAKHAKIVELSFEGAKEYFPKNKIVNVVGNPVRESVLSQESAATCRKALGLNDEHPILLFLGGSQGAQALNYFVLENSELLLSNYEIVHQCGALNYDEYKAEFEFMTKNFRPELKTNYFLYPFLDDQTMARALKAADIIVSRSGSSIWEIAASGRPAILVPLPSSANNHQFENAYSYAEAGAGIVVEEENMLGTLFTTQVDKLVNNKELQQKMSEAALNFYKPDAASRIAGDILSLC